MNRHTGSNICIIFICLRLHIWYQCTNSKKTLLQCPPPSIINLGATYREYYIDEGAHCVNRGCVSLTLISKFRVIQQLERFRFVK